MREGVLCLITSKNKVLLFLIEYTPIDRKWTGIGGFVNDGETYENALLREVQEESAIVISKEDIHKAAELRLDELMMHVYTTDKWRGDLVARDPSIKDIKWFDLDGLPYDQMFECSKEWMPRVLNGEKIRFENSKVQIVKEFTD